MKLSYFAELTVALVAGIVILILFLSFSVKNTARTPCDYLCKTPNYCISEKTFAGDENIYTEIKCNNNTKFIVTEVK